MKKYVWILILIGLFITGWLVGNTDANVIIKVRALNPLDSQESAVINYPLPKEITETDILSQKITYSMDHSEDEVPPSASFKISFDETKGEYYIDETVVLRAKEVVTLEVHVKDVWIIKTSHIEQLKQNVIELFKDWDEHGEVLAEVAIRNKFE